MSLAMIVGSVYRKLKFGEGTLVSYSGGFVSCRRVYISTVTRTVENRRRPVMRPKYTPVEGASLLAAEMFDGEKKYIEAIRRGFDIK